MTKSNAIPEYIPFSKVLKTLREEKGLTQEELANELMISKSSIQKYETAARFPNGFELINIKKHFKVSVEYLIGESNVKNAEYTKLEELGLLQPTIEYLLNAYSRCKLTNEKSRHNYDLNHYINLIAINNLIKKENSKLISMIGKTLISKKVMQEKDDGKSKYSNKGEYKYSLFELMNMFDEFFTKTKIDDVDFRLSDIEDMYIYNWDAINPKPKTNKNDK